MPKLIRLFLAFALFVTLFSCGGPPQQWAKQAPAGAKVIDAPHIKVGDTWVWKKYSRGAAKPHSNWEDKVIKVWPAGTFMMLRTDLDTRQAKRVLFSKDRYQIGYVDPADGRRYRIRNPGKSLQFPMWIGKRWSYDVKSRPYDGGHVYTFNVEHVVSSFETVQIAGRPYDSFRINRYSTTSDGNSGTNAVAWYVPELKCEAKFRLQGSVDIDLVKFTPGD